MSAQSIRNRGLDYFYIFLLLVCYLGLGILKWHYIFNPGLAEGPFLLGRYSKIAQMNYNKSYSDAIRYFILTPKWISTLIFGNLFLFLNLAIIYLVYKRKDFIKFTFWLFFWVSFLSVIVLGIGLITGLFDRFYVIVARIKELQQSPFTLILLLAAFRLITGTSKPSGNNPLG